MNIKGSVIFLTLAVILFLHVGHGATITEDVMNQAKESKNALSDILDKVKGALSKIKPKKRIANVIDKLRSIGKGSNDAEQQQSMDESDEDEPIIESGDDVSGEIDIDDTPETQETESTASESEKDGSEPIDEF